MLEQTHDEQEIIQRVAALDIGKAELVCCVRVPDPKGGSRRLEEVKTYSTMTRSLQLMADRLLDLGVTRVVMEATSDYWDHRSTCSKTTSTSSWSTPLTPRGYLGASPTSPTRCGWHSWPSAGY